PTKSSQTFCSSSRYIPTLTPCAMIRVLRTCSATSGSSSLGSSRLVGWQCHARKPAFSTGRSLPLHGDPIGLQRGFFLEAHGRLGAHCYAFQLDRKSTRLNSSHQIISYAVF